MWTGTAHDSKVISLSWQRRKAFNLEIKGSILGWAVPRGGFATWVPLSGTGSSFPTHASGLLFGPSAARILQKGFPAASNWIGFSYSRLRAPFWIVCGPYPSKRLPAASNWIGFSLLTPPGSFWTFCGPYPSKRLPAASNWTASRLWAPLSSCNGLDPAKWALRVSQRDLRLVYRAAGLFSRFKVSRWLHLFAPSRVAAPVGTAASSMLGHPIHWLAPFFQLETKSACSASCILFLAFLFGTIHVWSNSHAACFAYQTICIFSGWMVWRKWIAIVCGRLILWTICTLRIAICYGSECLDVFHDENSL